MAPKKRRRKKAGLFSVVLRILAVSTFAVILGYVVGQIGIRIITKPLGVTTQAQKSTPKQEPARQQPLAVKTKAEQPEQPTSTKATPKAAAPAPVSTRSAPLPASKVTEPTESVPQPVAQVRPNPGTKAASTEPEAVPAMAAPYAVKAAPVPVAVPEGKGQLWRVRVGKYTTREAADEALSRVQLYVPEAFVAKDGNLYRIQAGAFGSEAKAAALARQLESYDLNAEIVASAL